MHWLLLLALLSSTTSLKNGGSTSSLNRLAENSLRQQLGSVRNVNVQVTPGRASGGGNFDSFNVTLDGFSADRLLGLANRASSSTSTDYRDDNHRNDGSYPRYQAPRGNNLDRDVLGEILGGIGQGKYGGVLGEILGGGSSGGRIGRLRLRATNFTFQGTRYDTLSADMGEIRFDWKKALRGDFDIQSIAPGTLALNLRGDQVARLLSPRLPSMRDVRVRFADGRAFVGARSDMYGVRVPFEVGARLSVQQNRVMASDFAASVARLRLPSIVMNELTRGVNPLYDFDPQQRWPLAINLTTAQATGEVLAMRGGIQWLGFNNDRRSRDRNDWPADSDRQERYPQDRYPDDDYSDDRNRDTRNDDRNTDRTVESILGGIFGR
jgi:hypothetical protein